MGGAIWRNHRPTTYRGGAATLSEEPSWSPLTKGGLGGGIGSAAELGLYAQTPPLALPSLSHGSDGVHPEESR